MSPSFKTILIHKNAPTKPAVGMPCNGCGICCHSELCPLAILRFRRKKGRCPVLQWDSTQQLYRCGWLQRQPKSLFSRLVYYWIHRHIGANQGCDAWVEQL